MFANCDGGLSRYGQRGVCGGAVRHRAGDNPISGESCLASETIICARRSPAASCAPALVREAIFVQIEVVAGCGSDLGWASSALGIDLRLADPFRASELYRYAWLVGRLPVRVSIPSTLGVAFAVRVAVALGMAAKLEFPPGEAIAWDELEQVLDLYLHGRFVAQPIEPFHSLLQAAFHRRRENVWRVQDEDPAHVRYISEQGRPLLPRRLEGKPSIQLDRRFVARWGTVASRPGLACCGCAFEDTCRGYFQWPEPSSCCNARPLLERIARAAAQLADDVKREGATPA